MTCGLFIGCDIAGILTTTESFAPTLAEEYADQVWAEPAFNEELLSPLLGVIPVYDVSFGRANNRLHFPRALFDETLARGCAHSLFRMTSAPKA